jgi:hypothetical protein
MTKHCGNCLHHAAYTYPAVVFCELKYLRKQNPYLMNTLDVCGEWKMMSDECNCVEAAEEKSKP